MTSKEQLNQWLKGNSIHLEECCPDFSCCKPQLLASLEERKRFITGCRLIRNKMLGMFLGRAIALYNSESDKPENIYISK